ncbi:MAG: glycosyltransferase [Olegusella sp.]|nr:glycosyltransferase [Olegusella sp.]
MNPVIVIPSYWTDAEYLPALGEIGVYDHATPITKPMPELEICLSSLEKVRGVLRVIVLLVAPRACRDGARARVESICRQHPSLGVMIVGDPEAQAICRAVEHIAPTLQQEALSLRGYGAIRNMGLAVAATLGHDVVVFLDDDEVVEDEDFLIKAVYGLGNSNRQGLPIMAKTGYFVLRDGSPYADESRPRWCDRYWSKRSEFNEWMRHALGGTRICRSNVLCGGCFAVAADAYTRVAFDPVITRGEDLDYLFNLRMNGIDVWFDGDWCVKHMPPKTPSHAARFLQDAYRWTYEVAKLDQCNRTIGLRQVRPSALMPYPARWISEGVLDRIRRTALRRAITRKEHFAYFYVWASGCRQARDWALQMNDSYLAFQTYWPRVMAMLWDNELLADKLVRMGTPPALPGREA